MKNYTVIYRSHGLLSGVEPGEQVELDGVDAARLLELGLIEAADDKDDDKEEENAKSGRRTSRQRAQR